MSLKAVEIDPYLLAGLYRQPLIQMDAETVSYPDPLPFLGNNRQNILLLIHNETEAYLSEPVFGLLSNLLDACKLSLDDVALVNVAHLPGIKPYLLLQNFAPHKVILFGKALPGLSAENAKNRIWEETGCRFLHTDSLVAMQEDKQLKLPFWNALRLLFNLSA